MALALRPRDCQRHQVSAAGARRNAAQLEAQHWQQRDIFAVHLATEEALVNAIHHGNGSDVQKSIHVVCRLDGERIRIEIGDEGRGFNPAALPDPTTSEHIHAPCGRGVMLMRAFMSRVEFNEQGNVVVMVKERERIPN